MINKEDYFKQVPSWNADSTIEITGKHLDAISDIYSMLHPILNEIFEHNLNKGNIQIKYIDIEGNEIPKERVDEILKKVSAINS